MKELIQKILIIAFAVGLTITFLFGNQEGSLRKDVGDIKANTSQKLQEAKEVLE